MIAAMEQGYTVRDTIAGDPLSEPVKKKLGVTRGGEYPLDCQAGGSSPLPTHPSPGRTTAPSCACRTPSASRQGEE